MPVQLDISLVERQKRWAIEFCIRLWKSWSVEPH
jgi:hypothetical protein